MKYQRMGKVRIVNFSDLVFVFTFGLTTSLDFISRI